MLRSTSWISVLIVALAFRAGAADAQVRSSVGTQDLPARIEAASGLDRVRLISEYMEASYARNPTRAQAYGREALGILQRLPDAPLRADVLFFLGSSLAYSNERDSAVVYLERAHDLALRTADGFSRERMGSAALIERAAESERMIGHIRHDTGRYEESEAIYRSARDRFESVGNRSRAAAVTNDLAVLYKTQGRYLEALAHHTWALTFFEQLGQEREAADARHGLAVVYNLMGRYGEALEAFHKVLAYREREGDEEALATTLSNIGGVHEYLADYEQALAHYLRAYQLYESLGLRRRMATAKVNVAGAHFHLGHLEEARSRYEEARSLAEETGNRRLLAYIDEGMGRLHEGQDRPDLARASFDEALAGFEALGDRRGIATALISAGRVSRDVASVDLVQRAVDIATEMQSHQLLRDAYQVLAARFEEQGRFQEALEAHKGYKAAYDSLFNAESQTTIARLETEHQTREQEQRIALLEQRRQVQRMWMYGIVSVVGFLGVITALSFNRVRLRQRTLAALEQAHRAESERARLMAEAAEARAQFLHAENERKAQELEAARRMQLSMLPKEVPSHPEAELLTFMRTAAEVGGDYYDFYVCEDGTLTIAIGDATGHGTQAGTMVAAVKSLFSDYADAPELTTVLQRSARALRRMAVPNVYMALALARLKDGRLELAGAGMPPALVHRAATGAVEAIPLKGMPLGAPAEFPYTAVTVSLDPSDTLVLMSDGFPELRDESGAEFGYDALHEMVGRIAALEVRDVSRFLDDAIRSFSGGSAVRDDVTFVVLRMKGGHRSSAAHRRPERVAHRVETA